MVCVVEWTRDSLDPYVFPLVNLIRKGIQFELAPLYVGSLYTQLDECERNIVLEVGRYDVVAHANSSFLQVLLCERFYHSHQSP